jgi:hypothetical protein
MTRAALSMTLLAAVIMTGCALTETPVARGPSPPRAQCMMNPNETDPTPLFFLFCRQTP